MTSYPSDVIDRAHHPGQDPGAACLGVFLGLDEHQGAGLTEHHAVAVGVERAAGACRVVVVGRQPPQIVERRDGHGFDAGLDAAADGDIGFAENDGLPRLGDARGARRVGQYRRGDAGLGRTVQPDRRGRRVRHVHLDGQRVSRPHSAFTESVVEEDHRLRGAQRDPDRDEESAGVDLGRSRGLPQPAAQHPRHLLHVRQAAQLDTIEVLVEVFAEFTPDANRQFELVDERLIQSANPALALQQLLPGVLSVGREGSARCDGSDDDVGKSVAGAVTRHGPPKSFTQLADVVEVPRFKSKYARPWVHHSSNFATTVDT